MYIYHECITKSSSEYLDYMAVKKSDKEHPAIKSTLVHRKIRKYFSPSSFLTYRIAVVCINDLYYYILLIYYFTLIL